MRLCFLALVLSTCAFPQANPLTQTVTARYNSAKKNLIETAEAMPEADYGYQLTKEQRPFSGWIEHTAMGNYSLCAGIKGEKAPAMNHGASAKADLVKELNESFEYCDGVLKAMDDKTALTERAGKYPVNSMIGLIATLNEHYGNLVGYLRTKGITPPSSRPH